MVEHTRHKGRGSQKKLKTDVTTFHGRTMRWVLTTSFGKSFIP